VRTTTLVSVGLFATFSSTFAAAQVSKAVAFSQLAELTASDGAASDGLGYSVAMSGNTLVAGAPSADGNTGKAYVFVKPAGGWTTAMQTAELTPSDGQPSLFFGYRVAISGDTIVVDAGSSDGSGIEAREYVFVEPAGGWTNMTETAQLALPNGIGLYIPGIVGNTIVAGANGENDDQGAVYVFQKPESGWNGPLRVKARLTASNGASREYLGYGLAFDGNTIVASAIDGAVYVFVKPADGWESGTETAELTELPSDDGLDEFGESVAIVGTTIAVGAPVLGECVGAAFLYYEPSGGWANATQSVELPAPDQRDCGYFGASASVSGGLVAVGANGEGTYYQGAVYIFDGSTEMAELVPSDDQDSEEMGLALATSGNTIAAGAPDATVGSNFAQGKIYVFGR
jgi:hypothetical protein